VSRNVQSSFLCALVNSGAEFRRISDLVVIKADSNHFLASILGPVVSSGIEWLDSG
jgi:hypothetical protein